MTGHKTLAHKAQQASASAPAQREAWHSLTPFQVAEILRTRLDAGLTQAEAQRRLEVCGQNRLEEVEGEPLVKEFFEELGEPLILLLIFTGVLYAALGEVSDAITIFFVILTLNTIEVANERRAKRAVSALRVLAEPTAVVIREGQPQELRVEGIAPGDLIVLGAGRRVPADARLVESFGLALDESLLTGESAPVDKGAAPASGENTPLAERSSMVYAGTLVRRGRGKAVVVATGMDTELGRIAGMRRGVKKPRTPLQNAMDEVSRSLVWLALAFSLGIPILGVLIARQPLQTMLLTGLSLAFATIPEEMPIILTMVLALGGFRLSKQNAIVKELQAVETLGAVTVIGTDKTGTLTENRMEVQELLPDGNRRRILQAGMLCSEALLNGEGRFQWAGGDPLEAALIRAAREEGIGVERLESAFPWVTEYSFENARKRMSVVGKDGRAGFIVWVKGAPESVLPACTQSLGETGVGPLDEAGKRAYLDAAGGMAERGLRVIALAEKRMAALPGSIEEAESGLVFLGLAGLADPPRREVREAIRSMQGAGIRTIMITGDHPLTARAIGQQVGLDGQGRVVNGPELDGMSDEALQKALEEASIFARTTPEHKLRIVRLLQRLGERVAVTGDGANDAPALAAADIGVAMGETGSDVAREAGDIILADDRYTTIAQAVREGRVLFANLKKGVRYYLAIKVALVSASLLPVVLGAPVPFAPVQIILMELFMDLAAAAAFVAEPAEGDLMRLPPRDAQARFLDAAMVRSIFTGAVGLFAAVSAAYLLTWYQGAGTAAARTAAFAAWMVGHVLLAFNLRSERQPVLQLGLFSNRLMATWALASGVFIILATTVPPLQAVLKTSSLSSAQWLWILGFAFVGTFWQEVWKTVTFRS